MGMADRKLTRRAAIKGGAAGLAGMLALDKLGWAKSKRSAERPALVVLWLNGGPAGFFNSARSFLAAGAFGVTENNIRDLGNGLYVDATSFGTLPAEARAHMASI